MKHNYFPLLLALLLVNSFIIKGQQIPNSGFENWTNHSLNSLTDYMDSADEGDTNIIRSTEAQNGNYSVRIETVEETNGELNVGYFINFDGDSFTGGVPYTQHVDSIVGYYKANIIAQDSALVMFQFLKDGEIIGGNLYKFAADKNTTEWTRFSFETNMPSGEVPDTLMAGAASSNAIDEVGMEAGSWIELDNIKFYSAGEEVTPMPNNDFENWETITYDTPDYFDSSLKWNLTTSPLSIEKITNEDETNTYIRLNTVVNEIEQDTIGGIITNGTLIDDWPPLGGTSITQVPDSITYDIKVYRVTGDANDTGFVEFIFLSDGQIIETYHKDYSLSTTDFIHENIPVNLAQESDQILFIAYNGHTPGSYMELDNIVLHYADEPLTYVPDDNFENYLETHNAYGIEVPFGDTNSLGDGIMNDYVPTYKINNITNLNINYKDIQDLTGIKDFTSLKILDCSDNQLTDLDVAGLYDLERLICERNQLTNINIAGLSNLEYFDCNNNQLTNLDVSGLTNLTTLYCYDNLLTNLDVSGLTNLENFDCDSNQLTNLDVSGLTNLTNLYCYDNLLINIDVSGLSNLTTLYCYDNLLTNIDVSGLTDLENFACGKNQLTDLNLEENTNLIYLYCGGNQLTNLDVSSLTNLQSLYCGKNKLTNLDVSALTNLKYFYCFENQLTDLDVSGLTNLKELGCNDNLLTYLNIQNGNNENIEWFDATDNPDLTCIYVDDKDASYLSGWSIDSSSHFVETQEECESLLGVNESLAQEIELYPNPVNDILFITLPDEITASKIKIYNLTGNLIKEQELYDRKIPLTDIASGIYFVKIETNKGVIAKKLIKE